MNPGTIKILTSIVTTIIGAVLPPLVKPLIEKILSSIDPPQNEDSPELVFPSGVRLSSSRRKISWRKILIVSVALAIFSGFLGYYGWGTRLAGVPFVLGGDSLQNNTPVASPTELSTPNITVTPALTPTPIPRDELLMEINFGWRGEGNCNDYNPNLLGYENRAYYIKPSTNGYIAVCHKNDKLEPEGSLQVTAFPEGNPSEHVYYGFGVLFGWKGGGLSTTDACMFGVRRRAGSTKAVFIERVDGHQTTSTKQLDLLTLDNNPHTLRVVLRENGWAYGYLDERFIAKHRFTQCSTGPVGLVTWGAEDLKVYFDDLKLFGLP